MNLYSAARDNPIIKGLIVMNSRASTRRAAANNHHARRIVAGAMLGVLLFTVLWITMFSLFTSMLIGAGCCAVIMAASTASDFIQALLDAAASIIFSIIAVVAAIFGAIFSVLGF